MQRNFVIILVCVVVDVVEAVLDAKQPHMFLYERNNNHHDSALKLHHGYM